MMIQTLLVLFLSSSVFVVIATDDAGVAFLTENRARDDVTELPSGLQYKILVNGTGTFHPQPMCQCAWHYEGRLLNGHVFDSSWERGDEPFRVAPSQVIDGWSQAMHRMVQGDKWELFVPSELGYGESGHTPDIPGHALLIFTLQMVAIDCEQKTPALKCHVDTGELCHDREVAYLAKVRTWTTDRQRKEVQRLGNILAEGTPMKEDLQEWAIRREYLLKELLLFMEDTLTSDEKQEL